MKSTEISVKISIFSQLQLLQSLPGAMAPVRDIMLCYLKQSLKIW